MTDDQSPEQPEEMLSEAGDVWDLSLEAGEELPPVPPPSDMLVIDTADLLDLPDLPPPSQISPRAYPGVDALPGGDLPLKAKKGYAAPDVMGMLSMILMGALGGFIAWLLTEPFINDLPEGAAPATQTVIWLLARMGLFGACLGGMIGMALGCVEGLNTRVWEKAGLGAVLGLGIGAAGGFVGGVFGQLVYGGLGGGRAGAFSQVVIRALGWGVVGLFVGVGQGVLLRSQRKIVNGLVGGLIGGLVGGLLFDPLGTVIDYMAQLTGGTVGGGLSRLVAIVVMGTACGAAISLVEQVRKEAWLRVVGGPLKGKEFIIYRSPTLIGSSAKSDITLALDKTVAPQHASITQESSGHYLLNDLGSPTGTFVNQHPTHTQRLRSGDMITLGQTTLEYSDRAIS